MEAELVGIATEPGAVETKQFAAVLDEQGADWGFFGSIVTGDRWLGSDLNTIVIEDSDTPVTSTATNYVLGDWNLDTPRITKISVEGQLFQTDVYPSSCLADALTDWVLCDRLCQAVPRRSTGLLHDAIERVKTRRFERSVRSRRCRWYLETATRLLDEAAGDLLEQAFAARVATMLAGCAQLEVAGQPKRSYKRLYRQCEAAFTGAEAADFARGYAIGEVDRQEMDELLTLGLCAVEKVHSYYLGDHSDILGRTSPGLAESFKTTLSISADNIPVGKGILENVAIGDFPAAVDCLWKASLWMVNAGLRIEREAHGLTFPPGRQLAAVASLPVVADGLDEFLARILVAAPDQRATAIAATRRLVKRLPESGDIFG